MDHLIQRLIEIKLINCVKTTAATSQGGRHSRFALSHIYHDWITCINPFQESRALFYPVSAKTGLNINTAFKQFARYYN